MGTVSADAPDTLRSVAGDQELRTRLGAAIRAARDASGMSQEKVASLVDFWDDRSNISKVENGTQSVTVDQLWTLADVMGANFTAILVAAGLVDFDLPVKELLGSDPGLSPRGRRVLRETYDLIRGFEAREGLTPE